MARVRIPDELRDQIKEYVRESAEYDTQSEFVKDAIRRLLDEKRANISEKDIETIREIVDDELEHLS